MRSKLIRGPRLEDLQFKAEHLSLIIDKAEIEQFIEGEFERVAKQHGQVIQLDDTKAVEAGDILEVRLISNLDKFNKTVPLALGRGFFDKDVEAALLGMTVGQEKTIYIQDQEVILLVNSAKRKLIPEVTAPMLIEEFGEFYPEAQTVKEFKDLFFRDRLEDYKYDHYFEGAAGYISDELMRTIEITRDEEEYQAFRQDIWDSLKLEAKETESELEDYLHRVFSHDEEPIADIYQVVEDTIVRDFTFFVYAYNSLQDEIKPPTLEDHEAELLAWAVESGKSLDELRMMIPYRGAVQRSYIEEAQNRILDKFYAELVVELV